MELSRLLSGLALLFSLLAPFLGPVLPAHASNGANATDPWFARDKMLHFGASAGLAATGYAAGAMVSDNHRTRLAIGAGLSLSAGVAKELWDLSGHGDPSWKDLTWDAIGTATGLILSYGIDRLFFYSPSKDRERTEIAVDAFSPFAFERPNPLR